MKAVERHLYIRNGYYYFRKFVPRGLNDFVSFKEIWLGLNTQDLSAARVQVVQLDYEFTKLINQLKQSLSRLLPEQSPNKVLHEFVSAINAVKNNYGYEPPAQFSHIKGRSVTGELMFSDGVAAYLEDCPADAHSTREHKESTYRLFLEVMGNLSLNAIGKEEARVFKSRLLKMPANAKRAWNVDSFENIDWDNLTTDNPQHPRTINNRISYLGVMFNWAINAGYYHNQNPFKGLFIANTQKVTASRTHPFKAEELGVLHKNGLDKGMEKYASSYWVPLIGLYSGMRLNEICQLYVNDVREEDTVYIFDVNDDGDDKGLKTASSRRKIPIHNELIKRGLLDYVTKQEGKRLFPDISMGASAKNYSSTFTKRFWRLLKALEIKRDGLCFHSLRHTFIDGMRNAGVERSIVMTLTGHQSVKGVHDSYGYGYNLSILRDNLNKLTFPVLED